MRGRGREVQFYSVYQEDKLKINKIQRIDKEIDRKRERERKSVTVVEKSILLVTPSGKSFKCKANVNIYKKEKKKSEIEVKRSHYCSMHFLIKS